VAENFTFTPACQEDINFGFAEVSTPLPDGTTADLNKVNISNLFEPYAVSYSATPTFNVQNGTYQTIALTGNVTSSTISAGSYTLPDGTILVLNIVQDGTGGRTFAFPTTLTNYAQINTLVAQTASIATTVVLIYQSSVWSCLSISTGGKVERLVAGGRSLTSGQFALSGGWGSTASVGSISGTDTRGRFTVTSSGTGQGASPTITITFRDGAFSAAPYAIVSRNGGSQSSVLPTWTTTTTTMVATWPGTPIAAQTFSFEYIVVG
jgi:hypothetical protein